MMAQERTSQNSLWNITLDKESRASCTHIPEECKGGGGAALERSPFFQKQNVQV